MNQITRDAIRAFTNGNDFKRGNTQVKTYAHSNYRELLLHGNVIADMNEDGSVSFTSTPTSTQKLGAIPGTVARNTLGGFGLVSPELKTTYYDILNPQDFAEGGIASLSNRRG